MADRTTLGYLEMARKVMDLPSISSRFWGGGNSLEEKNQRPRETKIKLAL